VPEDRKTQGLVLSLPAYANVTLTNPWQTSFGSLLSATRERNAARKVTSRLAFRDDRLGAVTRTLSGGNQQKLVLAKWIARGMPILLVDEPTRGIDVGAKEEAFGALHALAAEGVAIVLVSSEFDELLEHCDRLLVMASGSIVAELDGASATHAQVLEKIFAGGEGKA
jgi:ABC-type sugar transport system ATPase subunit